MARALRQVAVHHAGRLQSSGQGGLDGARRAVVRLSAGARRHRFRSDRDDRLRQPARAAGGLALRRRDEEGDVRGAELPASGARRATHALCGEHGPRRRRDAVLRPLRHRQDDAIRRPRPAVDRRRRARLGRWHRVQSRGWLLRQVHRSHARLRAGDLRRHPLRRDRRERGCGRAHAGARLHRFSPHREHPRLLPARQHRREGAGESRRGAERHRLSDLRRERGAAAGGRALAPCRRLPLPFRLHRNGGLHRGRR